MGSFENISRCRLNFPLFLLLLLLVVLARSRRTRLYPPLQLIQPTPSAPSAPGSHVRMMSLKVVSSQWGTAAHSSASVTQVFHSVLSANLLSCAMKLRESVTGD